MKQRIIISASFLLGFYFFRYWMPLMNRHFKARLTRSNPNLVKNAPWFFTFIDRFFKVFAWVSLAFTAWVWVDLI